MATWAGFPPWEDAPCPLESAHINVNEIPATVCGAYAYKERKLAPLANIINRHSSFTALVRDVAVLILFTQFITACHHVHTFPGETSWKERKYLVLNKMLNMRNDPVKLTVADMENAEIDIARYVQ